MIEACARCGGLYSIMRHDSTCVHGIECVKIMDEAHWARLKAAYAFGKRFNPDHDTTSYFEQTREPVTDFKERARSTGEGSSSSSAAFTATVGGVMGASLPSSTNRLTAAARDA